MKIIEFFSVSTELFTQKNVRDILSLCTHHC